MDPTLAPGYVPPNGNNRSKSIHHWAEVQKARHSNTGNGEVNSESDLSPPTTPRLLPTRYSQNSIRHTHPRLASWRGARSALSDGEGIGGPADLEEVPLGVKRQALQLEDYAFPTHRLRPVMDGILPCYLNTEMR